MGGDATYHSRIPQTADSRLCSIAPNGALKETMRGVRGNWADLESAR